MSRNYPARKVQFMETLDRLFTEYKNVLVVHADNVGSKQLQQTRIELRGRAEILMGKNTLIRKKMKAIIEKIPAVERLYPYVQGNVGFIFTNESLKEVKDVVTGNKRPAPAKAGAVSPVDVVIPAGNTGLEPTKTSFLQALNIASKINKGAIEIVNDVVLFRKGEKVGSSEAQLLSMLNIQPFAYGLEAVVCYDDGSVYDAKVLDLTDDELLGRFNMGVSNIAALSLAVGFPTEASIVHSLINGFKNLAAVCADIDYTFPQIEGLKKFLENPEAFAAAAAAAAPAGGAAAAAAPEPEPEPEEEEEEMEFDLFD